MTDVEPTRRARERGAASPETWTWFAIAAPGLAALLARELHQIEGPSEVREVAGGVEFRGGLRAGYAANLCSRVATRVLLRMGTVRARELAALRRKLSRLPFEAVTSGRLPLRIQVSARRCRLHHTRMLAEALQDAVRDRLGAPVELALAEARPHAHEEHAHEGEDAALPFGQEPFARLFLRGERDAFTVSVDSSGVLLHRRGARRETGRAPLRETLAAAVLMLAGYDGSETLVNAMCGAGTIALEAADIALGRAPGRMRGFAFESFPGFSPRELAALRARAEARARGELSAPILAFDRDPAALAAARRNAERAGAARRISFARADAREFPPPAAPALLVANPPYGHRLAGARSAQALYRDLGARLRDAWRGHRVALLVPRGVPASAFGLRDARSIALVNGGLPIQLLLGAC